MSLDKEMKENHNNEASIAFNIEVISKFEFIKGHCSSFLHFLLRVCTDIHCFFPLPFKDLLTDKERDIFFFFYEFSFKYAFDPVPLVL